MNTEELTVINDKLDTLQDHLIAQDNLIKETLEHVESYLVWIGNEIEKLNQPVVNIEDILASEKGAYEH